MWEYSADADVAVYGDSYVDVCVEVSVDVERVVGWCEWDLVFVAGLSWQAEAFGVDVAFEVS